MKTFRRNKDMKKTEKIIALVITVLLVSIMTAQAKPVNPPGQGGSPPGIQKNTGWTVEGDKLYTTDLNSNVGIGTADPQFKLDVNGDARIEGKLHVGSSGIQHLIITSDGNVGIGNVTPIEKLEVDGNIRISGKVMASAYASNSPLIFEAPVGTERARIDDITGYMGIGTRNPHHRLDVMGNVHASGSFLAGSRTTYGDGFIGISPGTNLDVDSGTLFIDNANDRVGIGTTSPSTKLDVNGVITALGGNSNEWNTAYGWGDHSSAGYLTSEIDPEVGTNVLNYVPKWDGSKLVQGTIYDDGNIGIGTSSPGAKLDVEVGSGGAATIGSSGNSATGDYAVAMGDSTTASGLASTAMGSETTASEFASTAFGYDTKALGSRSFAIGYNTTASGWTSTALGSSTIAYGDYSFAMGTHTNADGYNSVAMGYSTVANGSYSIGMGYDNTANGYSSVAIGFHTNANGDHSTAIGYSTIASGRFSTSMGYNTKATEALSTAIGDSTTASGIRSTAMGYNTIASEQASTAMGEKTIASGDRSTAMGYETIASGYASTAIGDYTTASGIRSTAMGYKTIASEQASTAMGEKTIASGDRSTAMGYETIASGYASTAIGDSTIAYGWYSTAMGTFTNASGSWSTAMGFGSKSIGAGSTAMGFDTNASGDVSTAMGYQTKALGHSSIAMGRGTAAYGSNSIAMGFDTIASEEASTAMGYQTKALGHSSTAMGRGTAAYGSNSIAMGHSINASGDYSFGIGLNSIPFKITKDHTMAIMGGNVGIGTVNPSAKLDVAGTVTATEFYDPTPVAFHAYISSITNLYTSPGYEIVVFDSEEFDYGNNYDTTTGIFTAPTNGIYQFNMIVTTADVKPNEDMILIFYKNGYVYKYLERKSSATNDWQDLSGSVTTELNAGDMIYVEYGVSDSNWYILGSFPNSYFSGHRVT
jgi:hypothetical protein